MRIGSGIEATLAAADLRFLQQILADSLRSVYVLFVGVAALATIVAALLPAGVPSDTSS